jgi:hypothetical protein
VFRFKHDREWFLRLGRHGHRLSRPCG